MPDKCECGSTSFTKSDSGYRTCDKCGIKSNIPSGTLNDFKKKVSIPKPPKPKKASRRKRKPKYSMPFADSDQYEKGKDKSGSINFLGSFQMYSDMHTAAPLNYAFWHGALTLGHALGFHVQNRIQPGEVFHNLYILLVGESSTTYKSTSQDKFIEVYPLERFANEITSPEAFFREMSITPELIVVYDEFSGFLKGISKRGGYQSGFVELMNRLYKPSRRPLTRKFKTSDEVETIKEGYLSINAAVTEEMFIEFINKELAKGGFLVRYMLIHGTERERSRGKLTKEAEFWRDALRVIVSNIVRLSQKVHDDGSRENIRLVLSEEGFTRLEEITQEAKLYGREVASFAARYMNYVVKLADILLFSDAIGIARISDLRLDRIESFSELLGMVTKQEDGEWIVDAEYVDRAWKYVKPCLEYAKTISAYIEYSEAAGRMRYVLETEDTPISRTELCKRTRADQRDLANAIETLSLHEFLLTFQEEREWKDRNRTSIVNWYCASVKIKKEGCKKCQFRKECEEKYFTLWDNADGTLSL